MTQMSIEAQLLEYRARRKQEAEVIKANRKSTSFFGFTMQHDDIEHQGSTDVKPLLYSNKKQISINSTDTEDNDDSPLFSNNKKTYIKVLCFIIWILFFILCIKFKWGAVYFVISALIFIYLNTRTGPRKMGEVSAYSVFNKDCKSIDGTLTAEQFEKELRFGPGSV